MSAPRGAVLRTLHVAAAVDPGDADPEHAAHGASREWLVTNGLGGYAAGTLSGRITRRFHGLLIASLPAPLGRSLLLNCLSEALVLEDGRRFRLGWLALPEDPSPPPQLPLAEVRFEDGLPVWRHALAGATLERRLWMDRGANTTHLEYRVTGPIRGALELQPWLHFRGHGDPLDSPAQAPYRVEETLDPARASIAIRAEGLPYPPLRLSVAGTAPRFERAGAREETLAYSIERSRGYDSTGVLQSPGVFRVELTAERPVFLCATSEPAGSVALPPEESLAGEQARRRGLAAASGGAPSTAPPERLGNDRLAEERLAAELVLAADQFLVCPAYRFDTADAAAARGRRTVIAGYPWFTDWGRDTMISLEGLTLVTGRPEEARKILLTFAGSVRDGLIPNMFPEGNEAGLYHTADATLWYFHALDRYLDRTGDVALLRDLLPTLSDIVTRHLAGTRFGIRVDPADGLLRQGAPGYQLTWMDAKVGDLVVTPRRGKAVEINALFYNALRLLAGWTRDGGDRGAATALESQAERTRLAFNARFWSEERGHLLDVVDGEVGDDPAFRPNQILAISLRHPVLEESRWERVVDAVEARLVTPVGLRSLAPGEPDYKPKYFGDLLARDLAYHQGTVWAWLIGPFIDAWLRVHPGQLREARKFLSGFAHHLDEACVGTISEIFDAEPPYTPRGCFAQAWSVAEVLRCLVKTGGI